MFPLVLAALKRVLPAERLTWLTFGHVEADECGAMNEWLGVAPQAGSRAWCRSTISPTGPRGFWPMARSSTSGGKRVRYIDTPHVPHGWEAGLLLEETTGTLLCGDLFTHLGDGPALTATDLVGPAMAAEDMFGASSLCPTMG
jgi:flavorubredoxin